MNYTRLASATTLLALVIIVLGAYVRLTDAGLGCPDWPGCYGTLTVPRGEAAVAAAEQAFPARPLEAGKAWREMIHRYIAGILGIAIFILALLACRMQQRTTIGLLLPLSLVILVAFQGALGMWTVTLLLKPAIVTAHLTGGMLILALLTWLVLRSLDQRQPSRPRNRGFYAAWVGLVILGMQIVLGGWTSTNYAALACPDLPTCQGRWLPLEAVAEAYQVWGQVGIDYEGGHLSNEARMAVHIVHRLGAVITFLYIGTLALFFIRSGPVSRIRVAAAATLLLVLSQFAIGMANVVFNLPLALALAHNAGAALLLMAMVTMTYWLGLGATPCVHRRIAA
ncbi:MAG: heme A synthase [Gammaproteobacteria bacterium]|nr:heme A synthase [Gammaproteobacteria bacterium]